jgi:pimeloyl-ACP methyl ester carboxylesterase
VPLTLAGSLRLNALQRGEGSPVVLVHGLLLGSLAQWYFTAAPALAPRHRVVLYDLRGHGLSECPRTGYDLATQGDDLDALLAALGVDGPVDLVGHSFGALVALGHALRHPDRVRRLVLIDAPLPPGRAEVFDDALTAAPADLLEHLPPDLRERLVGGGRRARRLLERLAFLAGQTTLLADVAREPDLDDATLATLRAPVLCLYGERSRCRPTADRLLRTLPDARLRIVPGGHFVPVEAPAEMTAALLEFLDG